MGNKALRLGVAVSGGLALTVILALLLLAGQAVPVRASPSVLYVAPSGNCGGASPCYASVQAAVDAARSGDTVKVATGTYSGVSTHGSVAQAVYVDKTVTIQGGYALSNWTAPDPDAHPTTLDAQGQGRVLYIVGDGAPVIEGLTLTGGDAEGLEGGYSDLDCGGGIYLDQPDANPAATLRHNRVLSNTAHIGGGVCLHRGNPTLTGNEISFNSASGGAGLWMYQTQATLRENMISFNTGEDTGGGLVVWGHDTLLGNTILSNTSRNIGGGLFSQDGFTTLENNVIRGNVDYGVDHWWQGGGGLYVCCGGAFTLTNNIIADNRAESGRGGGMVIRESTAHGAHNTIARNGGGGDSGVYVFASGEGFSSSVAMTNTILVSHTIGISVAAGSTVTLQATQWGTDTWANLTDWGGAGTVQTGVINLWGDPAFADPDAGDYHIDANSAAIDAGVPTSVAQDIDGDPRPLGNGYDLGADEFWSRVYLPLVMQDHSSTEVGGVIRSFAAPAGTQPNGLAWDGNHLWMSSYMLQGGIFKLDPVDGTVLTTCTPPVAQHEGYGGLAFDGTYLWQADAYGGGIYQLDPTDCTIVHTLPSPANSLSDLAWDGQYLWVLGYPSQKMFKLDPTDGSIVDIFHAPSGIWQAQLAGLTYDGRFLWLSTSNYDLLKIEPSTGQVVSSMLTTISRPDGLAWDGSNLWIASFDRARLYLVYVG